MAETNFKIFNENYVDLDIIANYDVSSEDASFPIENIFNTKRRSKVWRSSGYYVITVGVNNGVSWYESGVRIDKSITAGTYSAQGIMTELERVFNLYGSSTYSMAFNNGYFSITSNGAGGTGIFSLTDFANTTFMQALGFGSNPLTGALSYTAINPMAHTEEWILLDMGVATNPDAFILTGRKDTGLQISPTATLKLQGNTTANFSSPEWETTITYDEEMLSVISDSGVADQAYRYFRFQVIDQANPNIYVSAGAVFLGNFMKPARGRANFPLNQVYQDTSVTSYSEGGMSFTDDKVRTTLYTVSLAGLQKADIEEFDIFFENYGTSFPFFVSMDDAAVWSSNLNRRLILCKLLEAPSYELISPDNFNLVLTLREEF